MNEQKSERRWPEGPLCPECPSDAPLNWLDYDPETFEATCPNEDCDFAADLEATHAVMFRGTARAYVTLLGRIHDSEQCAQEYIDEAEYQDGFSHWQDNFASLRDNLSRIALRHDFVTWYRHWVPPEEDS